MAAVVPDVFGDLEVCVGEIDDAAVPVPVVDEIVDDVVLVSFTDHGRQLFERNKFIRFAGRMCLNDLVIEEEEEEFLSPPPLSPVIEEEEAPWIEEAPGEIVETAGADLPPTDDPEEQFIYYKTQGALLREAKSTVTRMTKDPTYTQVKDPKSPLQGLNQKRVERLIKHFSPRPATAQQLQEGFKWLRKTLLRPKQTIKAPSGEAPKTKVTSMRGAIAGDEEDEFGEQDWEVEGSGLREDEVKKLIDRLYVSLGSIKAGNTSAKLREAVVSLLSELVRAVRRGHQRITLSLLVDSQLAKLRNPRGGYRSHDFRVDFNPPIELDKGKNYRVAMNRPMTMTYSWYNVAAAFNNKKLN